MGGQRAEIKGRRGDELVKKAEAGQDCASETSKRQGEMKSNRCQLKRANPLPPYLRTFALFFLYHLFFDLRRLFPFSPYFFILSFPRTLDTKKYLQKSSSAFSLHVLCFSPHPCVFADAPFLIRPFSRAKLYLRVFPPPPSLLSVDS